MHTDFIGIDLTNCFSLYHMNQCEVTDLYFMLDRIEFFIEYIEVEWSEFRLRHENVMPDAYEAQGVEAV